MAESNIITKLLEQDVEWVDIEDPKKTKKPYPVREGEINFGGIRYIRCYLYSDGSRMFNQLDIQQLIIILKDLKTVKK